MQQAKQSRWPGTSASIAALSLDQISKAIVIANKFDLLEGAPVFHGFNLVFLRNEGITFGLFSQVPWWGLTIVALLIASCCAFMMWRAMRRLEAIGWGLVVGGALGNVVDRIRFGGVTDFLDFFIGPYHWPAFNLADVAVVTGVAIIILLPPGQRSTR